MDIAVSIMGITFFLTVALLVVFLAIVAAVFLVRLIKYLLNAKESEIFGE